MLVARAELESLILVGGAGSHVEATRAPSLALTRSNTFRPAAAFVSLLLSALLYGQILHQMLGYWFSFALLDHYYLKGWVATMWVLTTLGTVMGGVNAFEVLTEPKFWVVSVSFWAAPLEQLAHALIVVLVQLFYVLQIVRILRAMYPRSLATMLFVVPPVLLSLAGFGCWMWMFTVLGRSASIPVEDLLFQEAAALLAKLCIDAASDLIITTTLIWILRENISDYRPNVFYKPRVGRRLRRLVYFLFARGLIVLVSQLAVLIVTTTIGSQSAVSAASFCIPNIYALSMLYVLTDRERPAAPRGTQHRSGHDSRISLSVRVTVVPEYDSADTQNLRA